MRFRIKNICVPFSRQARNDRTRGHFEFIEKAELVKIYFVFVFFAACFSAQSSEIADSANKAYASGEYENAIKLYEKELSMGEAYELYYNLGNSYYKSNNIPLAILNYERAKKLKPNDPDVIFNLELANKKIVDKVELTPSVFIAEWKDSFLNIYSEKGWAVLCILTFVIALLLLCLYLFSKRIVLRQISFWSSFLFVIAASLLFFCARAQYKKNVFSNEAIIISQSADVTGSPTHNGTRLFILHEGTKIKVLESSQGWSKIELTENKIGWIQDNAFIKI
jgi:tetratricopeptide (TPR) repeat protein